MAEITAAAVKALREETGLGMMECKKALGETNGDVAAAKDILRKKGLVTAEKKAGRATSEGLVVIVTSPDRKSMAMAEVRCETDFCARNDIFRAMVAQVADLVMAGPVGKVEIATPAMQDHVTKALAQIGENMGFSRGIKIAASKTASYIHHNSKVGVVLGVEGDVSDEVLTDVCMHIAFTDPMGITTDDVPADLVANEKRIATEQAIESGKNPEIAEKMVVGKIRKFVEANALIEQPFVRDDTKKIKDILGNAKVTAFARFSVGA